MATFVLVHGGAHGGWCYRRVAEILRAAGHEVHAPTMTGVGERSHLVRPEVDLDLHIRDVVAVLRYEDLRDVILVGHSYGGMVITGVADRVPDRIGHLVYLDAAMPISGESLADVTPPLMGAVQRDMRVVDGVELVLFPGTEPMVPYYGVTDPDDVAWMKERLTPHPWKCFTQPLQLTNEDALWAIPQSAICCTSTLDALAPRMERARAAGRVWAIDTGHDLMITEPEAVAARLLDVASS
jgi:pimeloyl-ACP methyl ester carboxylesterase